MKKRKSNLCVRSIEWHEDCLKNSKSHIDNRIKEIEGMIRVLLRDMQKIHFAQRQIEEAKRQGKEAFDRDRFGKSLHKEVEIDMSIYDEPFLLRMFSDWKKMREDEKQNDR